MNTKLRPYNTAKIYWWISASLRPGTCNRLYFGSSSQRSQYDDELTLKQDTIFDGYKQGYEILNDVKTIALENTNSIDEITMSISEMKEDINFIVGKTIRNDSEIEKLNKQLEAVR